MVLRVVLVENYLKCNVIFVCEGDIEDDMSRFGEFLGEVEKFDDLSEVIELKGLEDMLDFFEFGDD